MGFRFYLINKDGTDSGKFIKPGWSFEELIGIYLAEFMGKTVSTEELKQLFEKLVIVRNCITHLKPNYEWASQVDEVLDFVVETIDCEGSWFCG